MGNFACLGGAVGGALVLYFRLVKKQQTRKHVNNFVMGLSHNCPDLSLRAYV